MNVWAQAPEYVIVLGAMVLGLVLGSFYNVCILRYVTGESILFPPSHCPKCGANLKPWELVPVLSWVCLRGRCAHCRASVSIQYPLVEALSGVLAGLLAWKFGLSWAFLVFLVFAGIFTVASGIDFKLFLLPDVLTLGGAALALPAAFFLLDMPWIDSLLGGVFGFGLFAAVMLGFRYLKGIDGLGFGDVKLMLPIGFLCGWQGLPLVVLLAGLSALAFLLVKSVAYGKDALRSRIPFGPFLCFGFLVTAIAGPEILAWWLRVIL